MKLYKIIIIVGPTASGKSDFGVSLAQKINGEIISADSRQVYKGLDIGSGKITKKEMRGIPHYCLDIASPKKIFSAEDFKKYGESALEKIFKKQKIPIVVGGTGFYIDILLGRMNTANVPPNPKLRKQLEKKSAQELFAMLQKLDSKRDKIIDKNNPRRLIRAIEISQNKNSGTESLSILRDSVPELNMLWLGINRSPEELKKRIHNRLLRRLPSIIREIKRLHKQGLSWKRMNELGLEYRYGSLYVQGIISKEDFNQKLQTETWRYSKRQMTWWRRNKEINWIKSEKEAQKLIKQFLKK